MTLARTRDFPFYAGVPVGISSRGWTALMGSVAVAFAAVAMLPAKDEWMLLVAAGVFAGIPLVTLAFLAGRCWMALFRVVTLREIGIMLLAAVGAMAASAVAALIIRAIFSVAPNPLVTTLGAMNATDFLRRLVPTAPQLLGEELLTILPFLAILWVATQRLHVTRASAMWIALAGSTIVFCAAHLPTYHWQAAQCFGVIGAARLVLTLSYISTRNLWVPVGAHVLNDWTEFTFVFSVGHLPMSGGHAVT